jgi:hypothetical protein
MLLATPLVSDGSPDAASSIDTFSSKSGSSYTPKRVSAKRRGCSSIDPLLATLFNLRETGQQQNGEVSSALGRRKSGVTYFKSTFFRRKT